MTIVEFLTARLDERERAAKATTKDDVGRGPRSSHWRPREFDADGILVWTDPDYGGFETSVSIHIGLHDPAAVLADIAAKRATIALHEGGPVDLDHHIACTECRQQPSGYPCRTMRLLASAYADHADYDEGWKP